MLQLTRAAWLGVRIFGLLESSDVIKLGKSKIDSFHFSEDPGVQGRIRH